MTSQNDPGPAGGDAGLLIIQDAATGDVLGVFRPDAKEWQKVRVSMSVGQSPEAGGPRQPVRALHASHHGDATLALVDQRGPSCPQGAPTCFCQETIPGGLLTRLSQAVVAADEGAQPWPQEAAARGDRKAAANALEESSARCAAAMRDGEREAAIDASARLLEQLVVTAWGRKITWVEVLRSLSQRAEGTWFQGSSEKT
jgi:phosphoribosyl-ATP pyrophosphohydrolase